MRRAGEACTAHSARHGGINNALPVPSFQAHHAPIIAKQYLLCPLRLFVSATLNFDTHGPLPPLRIRAPTTSTICRRSATLPRWRHISACPHSSTTGWSMRSCRPTNSPYLSFSGAGGHRRNGTLQPRPRTLECLSSSTTSWSMALVRADNSPVPFPSTQRRIDATERCYDGVGFLVGQRIPLFSNSAAATAPAVRATLHPHRVYSTPVTALHNALECIMRSVFFFQAKAAYRVK